MIFDNSLIFLSVSIPNFPLGFPLKKPNDFSFFCISITSEPYIPDSKYLNPLPKAPYGPSIIVTLVPIGIILYNEQRLKLYRSYKINSKSKI